jgi:colanic acid biosynthesis glycosyl transferase WcaI
MTILLINQFFWPDSAATSQLLTDLAIGLMERGHKVHVICAQGGYAPDHIGEPPAVDVHRIKCLRFVRGSLGRLGSYASFFLGTSWRSLRVPRPDIVITLTTPPLLSLVGNLVRFSRGSKHFVWEMDMYPDVAVDLKYIAAGGIVERVVGAVADFSRDRSNGILALGSCMRERLIKRGVSAEKIFVAENWADSQLIRPVAWPPANFPLTVLYSGNLGLAHEVETVASAMVQLKDDTRFQFIFAGGGARRKQLEALCREEGIQTVQFRPYSSKMNLGESLGSGHIGLITQREECLGSVVPSKVYGLLAAGRPVLFIGPRESTLAGIINRFRCGWHIDSGDVPALVQLLKELQNNRTAIQEAGGRAREASLKHFDVRNGVARICDLIGASETKQLVDSSAPLRTAIAALERTNPATL